MSSRRHYILANAFALTAALLTLAGAASGNPPPSPSPPPLAGYQDHEAFVAEVAALSQSPLATVSTIGKSRAGRDIPVLTLTAGTPDGKPAILIVGSVVAPHIAGSELAMRMARRLAGQPKSNKKIRQLLQCCTVYVIPRPNPDGTQRCWTGRPWREQDGNQRRTDDDRDGRIGEDPADDLNDDGWITMIRVRDATGPFIPHPDDPRVMIEADRTKGERGRYQLYTEGRDNDHDENWNEDAAAGVSLNRNFPFAYPSFEAGAGPFPVSEPETRALADFAYEHPRIAVVLTFTPDDNLMHAWKPDEQAEESPIKTAVLEDDAPYLDHFADRYRAVHDAPDAPASPEAAGSFAHWAYFHYGRWSLATRGWWIPEMVATASPDGEQAETDRISPAENDVVQRQPSDNTGGQTHAGDEPNSPADEPPSDKRGADDLDALQWFDKTGIDGFVDWQPVKDHPDFPDREVEVGEFKPYYRLNPPADRLDTLAEKHVAFLTAVHDALPKVEIARVRAEPLGAAVFRVTAEVENSGYLPTMSQMGKISQQLQELQIEIQLPDHCEFVRGFPRERIRRLDGNGDRAEVTWLIRLPDRQRVTAALRVWMPTVGEDTAEVVLK